MADNRKHRIKNIFNNAKDRWIALRKWALRPKSFKVVAQRFKSLEKWAQKKAIWSRAHHRKERVKFWAKKKTSYRKEWKHARKKWNDSQELHFEEWMLNGHSGNIDEDLKPIVAWLVVVKNQTITDTYDYSGHASTSLHYPWNSPDNQGHAVDSAGPDMGGTYVDTKNKYSAGKFLELFGPGSWYVKNGQVLPGQFPGHTDHQHSGVA